MYVQGIIKQVLIPWYVRAYFFYIYRQYRQYITFTQHHSTLYIFNFFFYLIIYIYALNFEAFLVCSKVAQIILYLLTTYVYIAGADAGFQGRECT